MLVSPHHCLMVLRDDGEERLGRATRLARMRGGRICVADGCRAVTYRSQHGSISGACPGPGTTRTPRFAR